MLLAVDVGNTNITLGLWNGQRWENQWRLRTVHDQTTDEYGVYLKGLLREANAAEKITAVIISSVVPPLTATFIAVCKIYLGLEPLLVSSKSDTGVQILTENPAEVGADRIVNAAAAHHLYPGYSIVVDIGTATTFDVVTDKGELLGVAIAPGLGVAAAALSSRAAQLGRVALEAPPHAIGRNTVHAMQSGLIFGYVGLIEGLVNRITAELNDLYATSDAPIQPQIIGTGGLITNVASETSIFDDIAPWLTLTGLRVIYERNRGTNR
ncbi:MAG: type III pantothenate kinase [Candidatus Promineifilaceae bacterium]